MDVFYLCFHCEEGSSAKTEDRLAAKCLRFLVDCSVAGNNRVGWKTLNVGAQILGQVEMKGIYFELNALFISECKTSGEPLTPQVRPTSLICGACGYLCDAVARLYVFSFSFVSFCLCVCVCLCVCG